MKVYLDAPNLGIFEKESLCKAIDSTFVSTIGPFVPKFEEKFAKYVGAERAVSVQSGTAALHIALYELDIGKDEFCKEKNVEVLSLKEILRKIAVGRLVSKNEMTGLIKGIEDKDNTFIIGINDILGEYNNGSAY